MYNFDPHNVFLVIAINTPQQLKTGVVLQGHICTFVKIKYGFTTTTTKQGRAETFGGAGAQNIKGAHETRL